uniref:Uncharacterized protein n=2 Tax=Oryza sativa subsp. japonica TaxID=39947 RepID=Q53L16_ORYSJ|nr:hypothetical protein LOC_Os11g15390 [Oryza sativa Japonica Group]ABA92542.1 hypothetical protein LOC_Os11g15390 [Oryza sativa Japonica Group]
MPDVVTNSTLIGDILLFREDDGEEEEMNMRRGNLGWGPERGADLGDCGEPA